MNNLFFNINALLITNPTNIRYITGFVSAAPEEREAYLLVVADQAYLFTNSLYREQAKALGLSNCYIVELLKTKNQLKTVVISREEPFAEKLAEILKRSHLAGFQGETLQGIRLGFEENDLTVAEYHKLKHVLKNVMLVPTKNRIEKIRMIKREDEIENIREAAILTDECFEYIVEKLKPGVTESEIAWEIESHVHAGGAHELAFSPIVAFGTHSSQPHYAQCQMSNPPAGRAGAKCQMNDIMLMDFGIKVNGYCSDMTRVVFVGKPKDEWIRAYKTVLRAQESAINYLRAQACLPARQGPPSASNRSGRKADQLARTIIKEAGYPPYPHSLGHGVGLAIHEIPRLIARKDRILPKPQPWKDAILLPGMVVTIEPGIYIEGQYGIRIEDLLLIKENDIEILSLSPKSLIIL